MNSSSTWTRSALSAGTLLGLMVSALAQGTPPAEPPREVASTEDAASPRFDYQLGLALINSSAYAGAASTETKLRPVWGIQYGRFRVSTSRASLIERSSGQGSLPGASMELGSVDRWKFDAALRVDSGRKSSDAPELAGLPDVKPTLRLRVLASYALDDSTRADLSVNTDVANRRGGSLLSLDLGRGGALSVLGEGWRWNAGVGVQAADATYMNSYHGVPMGTSSLWPTYEPGAGLHDVRAGAGLVWRFAPHWRAGLAVGGSVLMGPAADSPLTLKRTTRSVTLGLVYIGNP